MTVSRNKIKEFREVLYDYGADFDEYNVVENVYANNDISFSPSLIVGSSFSYSPLNNLEFTLLTKFVGRQFLDNTSNANRSLDPYFVNDVRVSYAWKPGAIKEVNFSLLVNNIFNTVYESNGYTYGYVAGPATFRENYYFPQAGTNLMGMISLRF